MFKRLRFVAQHLQSTGAQKLLRHKMFAHACRNSQSQSFATHNFFMIYDISITIVVHEGIDTLNEQKEN